MKKPLPIIMGILNVTPDSFSDGGRFDRLDLAIDRAKRMVDEGADIIDVGGESTRPGSQPVSLSEEVGRVIPVVERLTELGISVSVDTSKAEVARQSIHAGAAMINDVTAMGDPGMAEVCAGGGVKVCLMHMQGDPRTMQVSPTYGDVVKEVREYLLIRAKVAIDHGISADNIVLDPGIGFGKTDEHNLRLIREIGGLVESGFPVLIGVSRKGFLGRIAGVPGDPLPVDERLEATLAVQCFSQLAGVRYIRCHDVGAAVRVARTISAIRD